MLTLAKVSVQQDIVIGEIAAAQGLEDVSLASIHHPVESRRRQLSGTS